MIGRNTNAATALPATANAKSNLAFVSPRSSASMPQAIDTGKIRAKAVPAKQGWEKFVNAASLNASTPNATQITAASPPIAENAPVVTPNQIRALRPNACLTPAITVARTIDTANGRKPASPDEAGIIDIAGSFTDQRVFSAS